MSRPLIFVSYTQRDGLVTDALLARIRPLIAAYGETYIDVLDNSSNDPQQHVLATLRKADAVFAIVTPRLFLSRWVRLELSVATERELPIVFVSATDLADTAHLVFAPPPADFTLNATPPPGLGTPTAASPARPASRRLEFAVRGERPWQPPRRSAIST